MESINIDRIDIEIVLKLQMEIPLVIQITVALSSVSTRVGSA